METIFAVATPPGKGGIATLRVSGPQALRSLLDVTGRKTCPSPRQLVYTQIFDPVSRETIDQGLVVFFKGPASFTGEDSVEYHLHGSPAVVKRITSLFCGFEGHRLAEPGEFTKRAFENGKLDLTEAEAVADLIHAETEMQRRQALAQLEGALSKIYSRWAGELTKALAYLEAAIDFADEELPTDFDISVRNTLWQIETEIKNHLNDNNRGERLREGIEIAIIGAPNSGKSTLINALARRDIAIVSATEGTTRDIIEAHLDIGGYPVILSDTAGLRPEQLGNTDQDLIEAEGIRRALERARRADITLLVFDAGRDMAEQAHTLALIDERAILVRNKLDLNGQEEKGFISVSARDGSGLDHLLAAVSARLEALYGVRETPSLTRERHRAFLADCLAALERARLQDQADLVAEDVRLAVRALGRITGRVDVEDLLDIIFRDFCIGK